MDYRNIPRRKPGDEEILYDREIDVGAVIIKNETFCPECNDAMRKEYHDQGATYYCSSCAKHFNACLSTIYMKSCSLIDGHKGRCCCNGDYWDKDSKEYDKNIKYERIK